MTQMTLDTPDKNPTKMCQNPPKDDQNWTFFILPKAVGSERKKVCQKKALRVSVKKVTTGQRPLSRIIKVTGRY